MREREAEDIALELDMQEQAEKWENEEYEGDDWDNEEDWDYEEDWEGVEWESD